MDPPSEPEVLGRLVAWAESDDRVRALVLTSSRARADATVDVLSDYDVVVAVRDRGAFAGDSSWRAAYARPLAGWADEATVLGEPTSFRGVVYEDGVKIDYTIWPAGLLDRVARAPALPDALDVGYRVLLDKDAATADWPEPTLRAHVPAPPSEAEFRALAEEFWWSTTYVAKALWRGDGIVARFALDVDVKHGALRRLLEWRLELDHGWSLRPGAHGRGLERLLPDDVRAELARTYVGLDPEESWEALFRTTALFRRVGGEVAEALGLAYPEEVDAGVSAQLDAIRAWPRAEPAA